MKVAPPKGVRSLCLFAQELEEGELLSLSGDGSARVLGVTRQRAVDGNSFATYNFAVEEFHTYFVGGAAVWVHNFCPEELIPFVAKVKAMDKGAVDGLVEKAAELILRKENPLDKAKILEGLAEQGIPKNQLDEIAEKLAKKAPSNVLKPLTQAQQGAVKKIDNIIRDHMTEGPRGDLSGALRDMLGNPVPKPRGGFYDHAGEVNQAVSGLRKALKTLEGATDPAAVAARQKALDAIRRAEEFTRGAGL